MGVNWIPGVNPETIPRLRFVPAIALPTVFGDALSYMEQVGKVNAAINGVIDNVNNLAADLIEQVAQSVESAKIPVYDELVHNGSNIISQLNWNLANPEVIYNAIGAGKMCIVTADCDFNVDHIPVPSNRMKQMMVLTQAFVQNPNSSTSVVHTTFTNYTDNKIRYAQINITRENNVYTSEVIAFTEYEIPTTLYVDNMHRFIDKKVMLYMGEVDIPSEDGAYIEIANNASVADLSSFFVVENGTATVLAPETCPCVVIDVKNGAVGQFVYGGDVTPWARIYGTGLSVKSDVDTAIEDIYNYIDQYDDTIGEINSQLGGQGRAIQDLTTSVDGISGRTDTLEENSVQVVPQEFTNQQKAYARTNIDAVSAHGPMLYGVVELIDDYGNSVSFSLDHSGNINYILFEGSAPIIRGIRNPVVDQDVATKGYVDSVLPDVSDVVRTVPQTLDETAKLNARNNIQAVGREDAYFLGTVTIQNNDAIVQLVPTLTNGMKILTFGYGYGNTVLSRVADPVGAYDAANKNYVDRMITETTDAVKYTAQQLTPQQKSIARGNIDAVDAIHPFMYAPVEINDNADNSSGKLIHFDYDTNLGNHLVDLKLNIDDESVGFYDQDSAVRKLKTAPALDDDDCVSYRQFKAKTDAIVIDVETANNTWHIRGTVLPSMTLEWVINNWAAGVPVIVHYPVADELLVDGYFAPKCANLRHGLVGEGYDGTAWKRYTLNSNGSVTIASL